jgi:hypothetical protein
MPSMPRPDLGTLALVAVGSVIVAVILLASAIF